MNTENCHKMIDHLKKHGRVFTEKICEEITSPKNDRHTDEQIYARDLSWLEAADFLVAEVSIPSLGVGYEIGKAEDFGIRILCLYNEGCRHKLSAMVNGNKNLNIKTYEIIDEALAFIDTFFEENR
jgi:hypothetical protein